MLAALLAAILFSIEPGSNSGVPSPASVSGPTLPGINQATANLLALSVDSGRSVSAPDFQLVDQRGQPVSLSAFRGKAVVLSFNDDRCTDVCTLLAQDIVRADQYLGALGRRRVVFLSVNVNPYYPGVRYVAQWSAEHDLSGLPNWYFATGPVPTLKSIWKAYRVYVGLEPKSRTVVHEAVIELVGPRGRLRASADFGQQAVNVDPFAHGLAQAAVDLLPASQRVAVAGPEATASGGRGPGLSQQAPSFTLPVLGSRGEVSLSALRGHPVVLNFWASSCTDCRAELAAFAQVARQYPSVRFIGVDVADPSSSSALALARRAGVDYPLVADRSGAVAASYGVKALPTTVYLDRSGRIVVYHPATFTAEQLRYTIGQFFFPNSS